MSPLLNTRKNIMSNLVNLNVCHGPKSAPATFEQLALPALPPTTRSYVPIGHQDLVSMIRKEMESAVWKSCRNLMSCGATVRGCLG